MLQRLAVVAVFALGASACRIETTDPPASSSSSSSGSSSGDKPKDPNEKASQSECKAQCSKRLQDDECDQTSTNANKACNQICLESATNGQVDCLVKKPCDDLTPEASIAKLCPK